MSQTFIAYETTGLGQNYLTEGPRLSTVGRTALETFESDPNIRKVTVYRRDGPNEDLRHVFDVERELPA